MLANKFCFQASACQQILFTSKRFQASACKQILFTSKRLKANLISKSVLKSTHLVRHTPAAYVTQKPYLGNPKGTTCFIQKIYNLFLHAFFVVSCVYFPTYRRMLQGPKKCGK